MAGGADEGAPIAYSVLEKGVPVVASDGQQLGTIHHVVAAPDEDIFHGLVIATDHGRRFVEAAAVEALHEHQVDLRLDSAAAAALPEPGGGAPEYDEDPAQINTWSHWVNRLTLRKDWRRRP
jgi:hypothetical protein